MFIKRIVNEVDGSLEVSRSPTKLTLWRLTSTPLPSSNLPPPLMEFYGNRNLVSFIYEEQRAPDTPPRLSVQSHHPPPDMDPRLGLTRSSSAGMAPLSAPSPGASPWTLSPLSPSPSPSPTLLYHCLASLHRQDGTVLSLAVAKGVVFTGSESDRVRMWKVPECADRGYVRTGHGGVRALLALGATVFTAHKDHKVRVWNVSVPKPRKLATLPTKPPFLSFSRKNSTQHKDIISCMAYYHAEGLFYTGSWDRTVKVWRLAERQCVDSFLAHEGNVTAVVVNQEDGCGFTASSDGSVKIWRRVFGDSAHLLTMTLRFQPSPVNALALSYEGGGGGSSVAACLLYSGSSDGLVSFWEKEATSGRYGHGGFLQGHRFAVLCLAVAEGLVFSGSEDSSVRVWRREEASGMMHVCLAVLEGHGGPVRCLAASAEAEKAAVGLLVCSASLDKVVKVWRVKVMPGEVKASNAEVVAEGGEGKEVLYDTSPVLSPSWVEKRVQTRHLY